MKSNHKNCQCNTDKHFYLLSDVNFAMPVALGNYLLLGIKIYACKKCDGYWTVFKNEDFNK